MRLIDVRKIWDEAPHNAFTDLLRWRGLWYCTFREGQKHVSPDGSIRVIASEDGHVWRSIAHLIDPRADLRGPHLSETPDGRLMLTGAVALPQPAAARHRSLVWFSADGQIWSEPEQTGDDNVFIWRTTWHHDTVYSMAYATAEDRFVRLYASRTGRAYTTIASRVYSEGYPNEASLLFTPDDSALCLLRRDEAGCSALLGQARPPYTSWNWHDLGTRVGGPLIISLPDGRIVAAVRLYDERQRTALCWLNPAHQTLTEALALPSGGDTSYCGMVWHDDPLWVSYYSSHEEKTAIYLARVQVEA